MNALRKRIEESEATFNQAMSEAKDATDEALTELLEASHNAKVFARFARMYAARLQRDIANLSRSSSLAESPVGGTTKDGEGRFSDFDLFDESDGLTQSQRRGWAAADQADMRRDFEREDRMWGAE